MYKKYETEIKEEPFVCKVPGFSGFPCNIRFRFQATRGFCLQRKESRKWTFTSGNCKPFSAFIVFGTFGRYFDFWA